MRAACVAIVVGVLVLTLRQPPPPTAAPADHGDVCLALLVVRDELRDRVPPPIATPEQTQAIAEVNADLASLRERLFTLDGIGHLGCQGGS